MKNNIENFIKENRSDFDDLVPDESVWDNIEHRVNQKNNKIGNLLWKAAAIIFFGTSVFLYVQQFNEEKDQESLAQVTLEENVDLSNELEQVEHYYTEMISVKRNLITSFREGNGSDITDTDFEEDLQKLNAMYEVLKKQFKTDPSEEVVDALVLNLLVRIDILNKELADLDRQPLEEDKPEINA